MAVLITRLGEGPDEWKRQRDNALGRLDAMSEEEIRDYLIARPDSRRHLLQILDDARNDGLYPRLRFSVTRED